MTCVVIISRDGVVTWRQQEAISWTNTVSAGQGGPPAFNTTRRVRFLFHSSVSVETFITTLTVMISSMDKELPSHANVRSRTGSNALIVFALVLNHFSACYLDKHR